MKNEISFSEMKALYENIRARPGMYYAPENFDNMRTYINGTMAMWPKGLVNEFHDWLQGHLQVKSPRFATYLITDVYEGLLRSAYKIPRKQTKADFIFEQFFCFLDEKISS